MIGEGSVRQDTVTVGSNRAAAPGPIDRTGPATPAGSSHLQTQIGLVVVAAAYNLLPGTPLNSAEL